LQKQNRAKNISGAKLEKFLFNIINQKLCIKKIHLKNAT